MVFFDSHTSTDVSLFLGLTMQPLRIALTRSEHDPFLQSETYVGVDDFDARVFESQTRRGIERAQLELDERKEELRLQKEREQLHKR